MAAVTKKAKNVTKCIDARIPMDWDWKSTIPSNLESSPYPVEDLPTTVKTLRGCAEYQIRSLMSKKSALTLDEEDALDDGFFLCDLEVVKKKLLSWYELFPRVKPFFALKCNPDPMVARVLGQSKAAGFDCASIPEIKLALASTNDDSNACIYANPQRAEKDLDLALALGITALTFDGPEELLKVHRAYQKLIEFKSSRELLEQQERSNQPEEREKERQVVPRRSDLLPPNMILRLLVPDEHSSVPLGEKFGAPPTNIEILTEKAIELGLPIIGVSFHCGSGCHDPEAYGNAIKLAKDAIDVVNRVQNKHNIEDCWLLDIGGGFPGWDGAGADVGRFTNTAVSYSSSLDTSGNSDNVSSSTDILNKREYNNESIDTLSGENIKETQKKIGTAKCIAKVVTPLLDELFPVEDSSNNILEIIAEPGRYFVEASFALCSRIYRIQIDTTSGKEIHRHYYIAQGVHGVFKDVLLCNESFIPIPLTLSPSKKNQQPWIGDKCDKNSGCLKEEQEETLLIPSTVHGPSGADFDIICQDYLLPVLDIDDWLLFDRMGAYTLSIAARSGLPPIRYVMSKM